MDASASGYVTVLPDCSSQSGLMHAAQGSFFGCVRLDRRGAPWSVFSPKPGKMNARFASTLLCSRDVLNSR
jgi:hypothetical protein